MKFRLSTHVKDELHNRRIPERLLEQVLGAPQQIVSERIGRKAYQSLIEFGEGKLYLLRAIVDESEDPAIVITVYRTSRIRKYWSNR